MEAAGGDVSDDAFNPYIVAGDDDEEVDKDEHKESQVRDQDRFLPIANVARIMKKSVPKTGKIAKDAKECVQECVSEFISFITSEASERCHQEKRKTINGEDILFAMSTLGFDNYVEPLKVYLQKYREASKGERIVSAVDELPEGAITSHVMTSPEDALMINASAIPAASILTTDPQAPNVIYTTAFPNQIQQFAP